VSDQGTGYLGVILAMGINLIPTLRDVWAQCRRRGDSNKKRQSGSIKAGRTWLQIWGASV